MAQGSNMTKGYNGMRKGISLVEMLTAIILFGLISVISYNYYKVFYDTTFAAKQTRVYTIINQAEQLVNSYDLYSIKLGTGPTTIQQMIDQRILSKVPTMQPSLSTTDWDLNSTMDLSADFNTSNGIAFILTLDGNMTIQESADYCNILNNAMNSDNNLTATMAQNDTNGSVPTDANATFWCYADNNVSIFVFKKVDETN